MAAPDETRVALTRPAFRRLLHYELEQLSKIDILGKFKKRFGTKTIRDVRFRVG